PDAPPRVLPAFPTRRSSDLVQARQHRPETVAGMTVVEPGLPALRARPCAEDEHTRGMRADGGKRMHMHTSHRKYVSMAAAVPSSDRKSTRLNSSHVSISYAV